MVRADGITLSFAGQKVFDDLSFLFQTHDRVGLVGRNGSGKSTLLKVISGTQMTEGGTVTIGNGLKIAYLAQDVVLQSSKIVLDEIVSEYDESDGEFLRIKARAQQILSGLGLSLAQMNGPVSALSVGWKMRVVLARLLLCDADFYLFDEPTNHLDIVAKDWFLSFLKKASFGFMLVSHERLFLDALCTHTYALSQAQGRLFRGNYSAYKNATAHEQELLMRAYVLQQKEIEKKQATIDRFRASSQASRAQAMMKELDRLERVEVPVETKTIQFKVPVPQPSGKHVLTVTDAEYSFGEKRVFSQISFAIERGEKVALIAANGVGKTTLLRCIANMISLQKGRAALGHNVSMAFYEQDQNAVLDHKMTIMEEVLASSQDLYSAPMIRNLLGAFLFSNDTVHKKISFLSGGEKSRVGMVKALLKNANFLVLDEPTNHLDMESKEILVNALREYQGTLLFVCHDHEFINDLATRVVELMPNGILSCTGNYSEYLEYKKQVMKPAESTGSPNSMSPTASPKKILTERLSERVLQNKMKKIETRMYTLEQNKKKLSQELFDHVYGTEGFTTRYDAVKKIDEEYEKLSAEWAALNNYEE